ncbi:hypothetical protein CP97_15001 (plasmid) [Aurantiacibacter atlanticus]|uniref:Uncharacterized protein n=1 Tax=Aurantiacibacter atlanticus TaxID=1648404 RepID=A0A160HUM4_9SPHN|nr:hypothetical protein CP97_15001 [Aurantiacibacter atlanticus]KZY26038.1 hypothetical protein A3726_25675 [Erythrobacter sp. HI0037]|tara:strand:+ start:138 stop:341 length:204 start_codon:yes stop_codon:yes gene_type:complete
MMLETAHVVAALHRLFEEQRAGLSTGAEDGMGQIIGQKETFAIANDADEYEAPRMGLVMRGAPRRLQ